MQVWLRIETDQDLVGPSMFARSAMHADRLDRFTDAWPEECVPLMPVCHPQVTQVFERPGKLLLQQLVASLLPLSAAGASSRSATDYKGSWTSCVQVICVHVQTWLPYSHDLMTCCQGFFSQAHRFVGGTCFSASKGEGGWRGQKEEMLFLEHTCIHLV